MSNPFLETLAQSPPEVDRVPKVLAVLDQFADAIKQFTEGNVTVTRELGFVVNVGQEYRILLQSRGGGAPQPMFRVYVPLSGYPVQLDLHQEGLLQCNDEPELQAKLKEFLLDPHVREQIEYFKSRAEGVAA